MLNIFRPKPPDGRRRHRPDASEVPAEGVPGVVPETPSPGVIQGAGPGLTPTQEAELARLREEIDDELRKEAPKPVVPPEAQERRDLRARMAFGVMAFLGATVALPFAAALPVVPLVLVFFMASGLLALFQVLSAKAGAQPSDGLIAALVPLLVLPAFALKASAAWGWHLPYIFGYPIAWSFLLLAAGGAILLSPRAGHDSAWRPAWGFAFLLLVGGLFVAFLAALPQLDSGVWLTFGLTMALVTAGLLGQWRVTRARPRLAILATPPALAVAAAQLLDGAVSWLAVVNPFGWLAESAREQMAVSAFILEWTGPGLVLVKWALALVLVRILDGPGVRAGLHNPFHRVMLYLVIIYVSAGPAIYSLTNLFRL